MTHAALVLALAAAGLSSRGALAQDVVCIATEGAYPPHSFINDAGEMEGLEISQRRTLHPRRAHLRVGDERVGSYDHL